MRIIDIKTCQLKASSCQLLVLFLFLIIRSPINIVQNTKCQYEDDDFRNLKYKYGHIDIAPPKSFANLLFYMYPFLF